MLLKNLQSSKEAAQKKKQKKVVNQRVSSKDVYEGYEGWKERDAAYLDIYGASLGMPLTNMQRTRQGAPISANRPRTQERVTTSKRKKFTKKKPSDKGRTYVTV